jgi:hypothetical protein
MTTERQLEANRRNAARSTGPRSVAGKALVARNALKHGAFATLPVVLGYERESDWQDHRAGILRSLAPAGLLETRLAERAALLLWRLDRVARYETEAIAVGLEEAAEDPEPNPLDELSQPDTDRKRLKKLSQELDQKEKALADTEEGLKLFAQLAKLADDAPAAAADAFAVLELAWNAVPEEQECPEVEDEEFLTALGIPDDTEFHEATWTAGLVRRGLARIAHHGRMTVEKLTARAQRFAERHRDELAARVEELAPEVKALQRKQRAKLARRLARLTLPEADAEGKVLRYENHLTRQLVQTLHELERIQASRSGRPVPVPLAVDVGVAVSGDAVNDGTG